MRNDDPADTSEDPPRWTIALPTFNGARHLNETLDGVLKQCRQGPAFELVICDDGSTDDTVLLARRRLADSGLTIHWEIHERPLGLAGNWNRCLARARTPLLTILHQDDLPRPGYVFGADRHHRDDPSLAMTFSSVELIDEASQPIPPTTLAPPDLGALSKRFEAGEFNHILAVENPVRCSSVTLKRMAMLEIGGFDERLKYAVDWECWARLSRRYPVLWRPEATVAVRWHRRSATWSFKTGLADLEEVAMITRQILEEDGKNWTSSERRQIAARARRDLASSYLNRAYDAACAGRPDLTRRAFAQATRLDPATPLKVAAQPRLLGRLALGLTGRVPNQASGLTRTRPLDEN
jgi:glycosyltransferase involved in cell wall biosynthesis